MRKTGAAVLVLALTLSGCGSRGSSSPDALAETGDGVSGSDLPGMPEPWTTDTPIVLPAFSDEQALEFRDEWLMDALAAADPDGELGFDPTAIPVERWVTRADYGATYLACFQDAGFPAVATLDGGYEFAPAVPVSQRDALNVAGLTCAARFPLRAEILAEGMSPEALGLRYDYWTEFYLPCLSAHGVDHGQRDIPSRDAFVATWAQDDGWQPPLVVDLLSFDEVAVPPVARDCPWEPPFEAMFGSE